MDGFVKILLILLSSILVQNFVLSRFLGICPSWVFQRKSRLHLAWALP